jgi:predicted nucleic acid-binding protein
MPDTEQRYYFDTVVLSNFALINRLDLLNRMYKKRLFITTEVVDEVSKGIASGFESLQGILSTITDGIYYLHSLSSQERQLYTSFLVNLGSGEASSIAAAKTVNGIVVTDDKLARNVCRETGIRFTGTIGILKKLYIKDILQSREADSILQEMITHGFYSPVSKISDPGDHESRGTDGS